MNVSISILALLIISYGNLKHSPIFSEPRLLYGSAVKLRVDVLTPSNTLWEATIFQVLCWTCSKSLSSRSSWFGRREDRSEQSKNKCTCGQYFKVVFSRPCLLFTEYPFQLQIVFLKTSGEAWDSSFLTLCATGTLPEPCLLLLSGGRRQVHVGVCAHRSQRLTSGVFLSHFPTLCFEIGLLTKPGSYQFISTSRLQSSGSPVSTLPGASTLPGILMQMLGIECRSL